MLYPSLRRTRALGGLVAVCLLLLQVSGHAYVAKNSWAELPVLIYVGGIGSTWTSATIGALRAWNSEAAVAIFVWSTSRYYRRFCGGAVTSVTWESSSCDGKDMAPKTLAETVKWFRDGRIVAADVYFNTDRRWSTYSGEQWTNNVIDFRRIALHEFGHALGLGHTPGEGRVIMNAHASDIDRLQRDDINGARALYANRGTGGGSSGTPDLQMRSFRLNDYNVRPRQKITLRTTVRNIGTGVAAATKVIYFYWDSRESDWLKMNVSRTVNRLSAQRSASQSAATQAPGTVGAHHFGACVLAVDRERTKNNQCETVSFSVQ